MPPSDLPQLARDVCESTARLLLGLGTLTADDVRRPSLLPDWSSAHLLTHLARNADALAGTLDGSRRGVPTPMYPHGPEGRAADIEAGAAREVDALVEDVRAAAQRLDEVWLAMTPETWDIEVQTRTGTDPGWKTVNARWREVEIHWVDLDMGYGPEDWPADFTRRLLRTMTGRSLPGRLPAGARLSLQATDTGESWSAGPASAEAAAAEVEVYGPSWALACWLTGRTAPVQAMLKTDGGDLPVLGPWL
jgi:maleylpyruvate isomerase